MNLRRPTDISEEKLRQIQREAIRRKNFYYNESCADAAAKLLTELHANPSQAIRIHVKSSSVLTLRQQYYSGAKYLMEHKDPSGDYASLYAKTKCSAVNPDYLELTVKQDRTCLTDNVEHVTPWRDELGEFLENAKPNEKFFRDNIVLTEDDIIWIQNQLVSLVKADESPLFFGSVEIGKPLLIIRDEN